MWEGACSIVGRGWRDRDAGLPCRQIGFRRPRWPPPATRSLGRLTVRLARREVVVVAIIVAVSSRVLSTSACGFDHARSWLAEACRHTGDADDVLSSTVVVTSVSG